MTATDLGGNAASGSYTVTVDSTAPAVSAAVVSTSATSTPGWIKQGGTYIIYANATDGGAINTVKANVAGLTAGQTAVSLSACTSSCTVGGVTYGYKSSSKTADAGDRRRPGGLLDHRRWTRPRTRPPRRSR